MKQFKIMIALLAVAFSVSSAFSSNSKFVNSWFSYSGNTPIVTASFGPAVASVSCPGDDVLCAIQVQKNANGRPNQAAFDLLKSESGGFTHSGDFAHGFVGFKYQD